ncbi:hypothetical protein, partial [Brevibacillus sp. SIMBA_040]|uniref:hypothetical protein n=1 Tax=Brevibacillus sp. SIMBA_040 TaxID=3085781 RepID=UPI00397DAEE4
LAEAAAAFVDVEAGCNASGFALDTSAPDTIRYDELSPPSKVAKATGSGLFAVGTFAAALPGSAPIFTTPVSGTDEGAMGA